MRALRQSPPETGRWKSWTSREREVFDLLVGMSVRAIADKLELSHKPSHVHRANVLGKLQCDSNF